MDAPDFVRLIAALALLLVIAHACARLFTRFRQPAVIGEITAGFLLGPTVAGSLARGVTARWFPLSGPVALGLDVIGQIGQMLLLFDAAAELRGGAGPEERRSVVTIAAVGMSVPFAIGGLVARLAPYRLLAGPHGSHLTVSLVFATAAAVASVPVISRIMTDLGITGSSFARIVLTVAITGDIVLYIVLDVILGLAGRTDGLGPPSIVRTASVLSSALYYSIASVGFLGILARFGPAIYRWLARRGAKAIAQHSPIAFQLFYLCLVVLCSVALGITPIFGALVAGLTASRADAPATGGTVGDRTTEIWKVIKNFAFAFFIPVYFADVGLRLNLVKGFDALFFCWFLLFVCGVKVVSVWGAAQIAGHDRQTATRLAIALSAQGTMGIILATTTRQAGVISGNFFASLVMLSLVTSQIAGAWLGRPLASARAEPSRSQPDETVPPR